MFGRRNPETLPPAPARPSETSVDLDILADLPELPQATTQRKPQPETAFERAWQPASAETYAPAMPEERVFVPTQLPATEYIEEEPVVTPTVAQPVAAAAPAKSSAESVIGPDDFFDGNYRSERGVRLQGNVRGSIESRQYIYVEAGAHVEASLSAEEIVVSGDYSGTIECRGRLEISKTGRVQGQVTTASLVVHEGGLLDGQLHMKQQ